MLKMSCNTFLKQGYLMEVNRLFFHPLGMALVMEVDDGGEVQFAPYIQITDDPEGFVFEDDDLGEEEKQQALRIAKERQEIAKVRLDNLNWLVQPILFKKEG